jgi:hypothetical protein
MKGRAIVELHLDEVDEVFDVARSVLRIKADLDLSKLCRNGHAGINFLKFDAHNLRM